MTHRERPGLSSCCWAWAFGARHESEPLLEVVPASSERAAPKMPDELTISLVMSVLDARGLATLCQVCSAWRRIELEHQASLWAALIPADLVSSSEDLAKTWPSPAKRIGLLLSREHACGTERAGVSGGMVLRGRAYRGCLGLGMPRWLQPRRFKVLLLGSDAAAQACLNLLFTLARKPRVRLGRGSRERRFLRVPFAAGFELTFIWWSERAELSDGERGMLREAQGVCVCVDPSAGAVEMPRATPRDDVLARVMLVESALHEVDAADALAGLPLLLLLADQRERRPPPLAPSHLLALLDTNALGARPWRLQGWEHPPSPPRPQQGSGLGIERGFAWLAGCMCKLEMARECSLFSTDTTDL